MTFSRELSDFVFLVNHRIEIFENSFFSNNNKKYAGWKQIKQVTKVYTNDIYVVEKPNKITPMHTSSNDKNKQAEQQAQSTNKLCKHKNLIK